MRAMMTAGFIRKNIRSLSASIHRPDLSSDQTKRHRALPTGGDLGGSIDGLGAACGLIAGGLESIRWTPKKWSEWKETASCVLVLVRVAVDATAFHEAFEAGLNLRIIQRKDAHLCVDGSVVFGGNGLNGAVLVGWNFDDDLFHVVV
jgi:hypothetical protein